jgi:hypothetical protein
MLEGALGAIVGVGIVEYLMVLQMPLEVGLMNGQDSM